MGRRIDTDQAAAPGLDAEAELRVLRTLLMNSEPGTPAATLSQAIRSHKLTARTPPDQVAELREFIASIGLEGAADRALAARARRR